MLLSGKAKADTDVREKRQVKLDIKSDECYNNILNAVKVHALVAFIFAIYDNIIKSQQINS